MLQEASGRHWTPWRMSLAVVQIPVSRWLRWWLRRPWKWCNSKAAQMLRSLMLCWFWQRWCLVSRQLLHRRSWCSRECLGPDNIIQYISFYMPYVVLDDSFARRESSCTKIWIGGVKNEFVLASNVRMAVPDWRSSETKRMLFWLCASSWNLEKALALWSEWSCCTFVMDERCTVCWLAGWTDF